MNEKENDINEIIIRYLDGSADLAEKVWLLQWLKQSDSNCHDFTLTRDLWLSCNAAVGNELAVDIALGKFKNRILQQINSNQKITYAKIHRLSIVPHWVRIASILLLVLGLGYLIGGFRAHFAPRTILQSQLITAKGSKGRFMLPDGSIVWLNSETKLTYPNEFAVNKRLVRLEGEAYFEVAKDPQRPFIVQTAELDFEVLGTCFDLDSYSSNEFVETALLNGSLRISGKTVKEPITLKPNELFRYTKSNQIVSVEETKTDLYADWIKDRLIFDNDCLSDILISMEGRYNMDIECSKQLADSIHLSFTIRQETIEEVMNAMSCIAPIRYEIRDGKVYIKRV